MIRLHFLVEGKTEKSFVATTLRDHFASSKWGFGVFAECFPTGTSRQHAHKGGVVNYEHLRNHLHHRLSGDTSRDLRVTTMIDFYKLPANFPGYKKATQQRPLQRVLELEAAWQDDVKDRRFIPFIALHEFEALLLVDPDLIAAAYAVESRDSPSPKRDEQALRALKKELQGFANPEDVNDGADTAPSKRLIRHFPRYQKDKVIVGAGVAAAIGLRRLRERCPHFNDWIDRLESLMPPR